MVERMANERHYETREESGRVNCYTGACAECGNVVAVTVAPVNEPDTLERALKDRRAWIKRGLVAGVCIVSDVWEGRVVLFHTQTCSKARKRLPRRERQS